MDWDQFAKDIHLIWDSQPVAILLLAVGFLIFVYLVIDARRHKRRRRGPKLH